MPRFTLSSHSGSNLPSSCTVSKTEATTRLFTIAGYSQCARKLVGSVLEFDRFRLGDRAYRLKVYPAGLDEESAGFVAVLVTMEDHWDSFLFGGAARTIFIEILDKDGERAVFDNNTVRSEQTLLHHNRSKGYVRFVARRDLDESTCVRDDDSFTVRCTLSREVEVTTKLTYPRPPPKAC